MKMRFFKPAALVFAAGLMYSCASSNETMDTTAMDDTTTISETQTMAGDDVTTNTDVSTDMTTTTTTTTTEMGTDMDMSTMSIMDAARTKSEISTFMNLLEAANVTSAFQGEGEFTIFAPTNEAFEQLPAGQLEYLQKPENRNELIKVLQAHVLANKVTTAQLQSNQRIQISETDYIEIGNMAGSTNPNNFTIGGANIVESNIETNNGVIHIVDRVLVTADRVSDDQ